MSVQLQCLQTIAGFCQLCILDSKFYTISLTMEYVRNVSVERSMLGCSDACLISYLLHKDQDSGSAGSTELYCPHLAFPREYNVLATVVLLHWAGPATHGHEQIVGLCHASCTSTWIFKILQKLMIRGWCLGPHVRLYSEWLNCRFEFSWTCSGYHNAFIVYTMKAELQSVLPLSCMLTKNRIIQVWLFECK